MHIGGAGKKRHCALGNFREREWDFRRGAENSFLPGIIVNIARSVNTVISYPVCELGHTRDIADVNLTGIDASKSPKRPMVPENIIRSVLFLLSIRREPGMPGTMMPTLRTSFTCESVQNVAVDGFRLCCFWHLCAIMRHLSPVAPITMDSISISIERLFLWALRERSNSRCTRCNHLSR